MLQVHPWELQSLDFVTMLDMVTACEHLDILAFTHVHFVNDISLLSSLCQFRVVHCVFVSLLSLWETTRNVVFFADTCRADGSS